MGCCYSLLKWAKGEVPVRDKMRRLDSGPDVIVAIKASTGVCIPGSVVACASSIGDSFATKFVSPPFRTTCVGWNR